jgi:hypothetical protein
MIIAVSSHLTCPFDRLRAGSFDRLRAGSFDRLRAGSFDRLRASSLRKSGELGQGEGAAAHVLTQGTKLVPG